MNVRATLLIALAVGRLAVGSAQAEPAQPVRIDVQLDWKANAQFAGLLLARERGWYAEAGLDVTIRANDFKRSYLEVVAESDHTIGTSESRSLVAARGRGMPIRAVATILQSSPIVLISKQARGIRTARDLEGKTIGIHRPEDLGMLAVYFAHAGIAEPKFQWKKVGFEMRELLADEVDAAQGYSVGELVDLRRRGEKVDALSASDNGWVDYAQVFFTSEAFLKNNPAAVGKFLTVTFRGWRVAVADIPATARLIVEKYTPETDQGFVEKSLEEIAPLLTQESSRMGVMRRETWEAIFEMFRNYHLAQPPERVDDLVDFRFVPEL